MGLLAKARVAIDGLTFKAVNCRDNNFTKGKLDFIYLPTEHIYTCPAGKNLRYYSTVEENGNQSSIIGPMLAARARSKLGAQKTRSVVSPDRSTRTLSKRCRRGSTRIRRPCACARRPSSIQTCPMSSGKIGCDDEFSAATIRTSLAEADERPARPSQPEVGKRRHFAVTLAEIEAITPEAILNSTSRLVMWWRRAIQ